MVAIHETAYPRIKAKLSDDELDKIFTPSSDDITFAKANTRAPRTRLGFLILLKSFQRLGYFSQFEDLPQQVIDHIAKVVKVSSDKQFLIDYERNGYRYRHIPLIRSHLAILPYSKGGQRALIRSLAESAQSKDDLADLINCGLEALVAKRYEVPGFSTFVKAAQKVRYLVNKATYLLVMKKTSSEQQTKLEELFLTDNNAASFWHDIKQDPGPATVKNMRIHVARLKWLRSLKTSPEVFEAVPFARYRRFVAEARSLDSGRMKTLGKNKRITLASALVCDQIGTAHDDLADMFIKSCSKMHWAARRKLETLKQKNQAKADDLVLILATITNVWSTASKEEKTKQLEQVFAVNKPKEILKSMKIT